MYISKTDNQPNFGIRAIKPVGVSDDVWKLLVLGKKDEIYEIGPKDCDCIIIQDPVSNKFIVGAMTKLADGAYALGAKVGHFFTQDLIKDAVKLMEQARTHLHAPNANEKLHDSKLLEQVCAQLMAIFKGEKRPTPNIVFERV